MKALFTGGGGVPLGRALREHRTWLVPLAIVLAINAVLLIALVLPLSRGVASSEQRGEAARSALAAAEQELKSAEALRDGKAQATTDLDAFYRDVLPQDVSAARRLIHVKLAQMANSHDVLYGSGSTQRERLKEKESELERLHVSMRLTGEYADIRAFLHELETAADFVVIDNMLLSQGQGQDEGKRREGLSLTLDVSTYYRTQASTDAR